MSLANVTIARGGITGLLTRVMRRAASDHAHLSNADTIAAAQNVIDTWHRDRAGESGWAIYSENYSPADDWRAERADRWRYNAPQCRGGWPTVTIEEVTLFDAPHSSDGSIGTVLACYDTDKGQACALYGFREDGSLALWAN
jgi:hypothetical protein